MLSSLRIENVAVIKQIEIELPCGFSALTGETGAGKSIIIDCIGLLMGDKADKELIRKGENAASVSGVFSDISAMIEEELLSLGIPVDEERKLHVYRSFTRDGKSSVKLNGRAVNLAVLRSVVGALITLHGQSDTNALVDPSCHIEMLDLYSGSADLLGEYRAEYEKLESLRRRIAEIRTKSSESARLGEILAYQIKDIDALGLHEGEEEELVDKKVKLKNSEKIAKNCDFVFRALKGGEKGSVSYLLDRCVTALTQLSGVVGEFETYAETLRNALYQAEDIAEEVYSVLDEIDSDPTETLNMIEGRLDKISKLKRKYGPTVSAILEFRDNAKRELDALENSDVILGQLEKEESEAYSRALVIAEALHTKRTENARILEEEIKKTLEFLDMPKVVFFTRFSEHKDGERKALNKDGYDTVEFYISANRGADAQSVSKIASGGELARVMLALKCVLADKDGISTVIFDEIDAGVSGKTARKIGIKMLSLSSDIQVICVTHSAQIASLSDIHFFISKSDVNGATETAVTVLDRDGRIAELSRILGGINVTESQRNAAIDMLEEKSVYNN